jgi:two-component system LytT family response regulator
MIRALIADDEHLARKQIVTALDDFSQIEICAQSADGIETVNAIVEQKPDLIFLDIQMPEMDGMDVINTIGAENMPFIIFVTAFDKYAVAAFEKHAFDYLLKPFSPKRFQEAVSRVVQFIEQENDKQSTENLMKVIQELKPKEKYISRIAIRSTSRIYFLQVSEIDWIESAGNYVEIYTGDKTHLLRETMTNLESKLDPEHFIRIHRTAIVNINRIVDIQPDTYDFIVRLQNGKTLGMSRRYKEKLNALIQQRF